nr:MAG TPA: hypothetical protein [Bacteriophage sp.]
MKKYIRLGEIPADGKSVNFLKLTKKQKDNFRCASKSFLAFSRFPRLVAVFSRQARMVFCDLFYLFFVIGNPLSYSFLKIEIWGKIRPCSGIFCPSVP